MSSVRHWFSGGKGGSIAGSLLFDEELHELVLAVAPRLADGVRSLAVTSAEPGEGRTTTATSLAEALVDHLGLKVLLVDADGRRPQLHNLYRLPQEPGLADVLRGQVGLREAVVAVRDTLLVLPVGTGGLAAGEVVTRAAVEAFMAEVTGQYEVTVLDTGPLLAAQEAMVFCHSAAGVLLVLLAGATQGETVGRAQRLLKWSHASVLGVVVNDPGGEFMRHES